MSRNEAQRTYSSGMNADGSFWYGETTRSADGHRIVNKFNGINIDGNTTGLTFGTRVRQHDGDLIYGVTCQGSAIGPTDHAENHTRTEKRVSLPRTSSPSENDTVKIQPSSANDQAPSSAGDGDTDASGTAPLSAARSPINDLSEYEDVVMSGTSEIIPPYEGETKDAAEEDRMMVDEGYVVVSQDNLTSMAESRDPPRAMKTR